MHFKAAYCGMAMALAIAACGPNPADIARTAEEAAIVQAASGIAALGSIVGGQSHPAMTAYTDNISRIADAIANVKDESSARAAAQVIGSLAPQMEAQAKELERLSDAQKAAAVMAHAQVLLVAQQKMGLAMANLAMNHPDLLEVMQDEINSIPSL